MKIKLTNMPKLKLQDLLKRRKMTLVTLLGEFGITTYEGLKIKCDRMGVVPPAEADFTEALGVNKLEVNNPQDGIIVVEAPRVIEEQTGRAIDPEAPVLPEVKVITQAVPPTSGSVPKLTDLTQKKQYVKKDVNQGKQ